MARTVEKERAVSESERLLSKTTTRRQELVRTHMSFRQTEGEVGE